MPKNTPPPIVEQPEMKPPKKRRRRWPIIVTIILGALVVLTAYTWKVEQSVVVPRSNGNLPTALNQAKTAIVDLTKEGDSRLNIVLLGYGGGTHDGAELTDTVQLMSLDLINHQGTLMSIPRDLYVKAPVGGSMKINAVYQTGNAAKKDSGGGMMKDFVGGMADLNVHYFLAMNFDGFKELVDMLGGVDINVVNPINDYEYPNAAENGLTTFRLKAGLQHMDGTTALKYARSRHSSGAEGSDFARSARQQLLISAIKDKATKEGYFKNPVKVVQMVNLLAKYIKTDMTPNEIKLLAEKLSGFDTSKFASAVLSNSAEGLLVDGQIPSAGYTLVPRAGNYDYSQIARLFHKLAPDPLIAKEAAHVRILYPPKKLKDADKLKALLTDYGYSMLDSSPLPTNQTAPAKTTITDYRRGKLPYTINYLKNRLKAAVDTDSTNRDDLDIDITLGQ